MFQEAGLWEWDFSGFETAGSHFCLLSSAFGSLSSSPLCTKISYALSRISQITVESYVRVADELSPGLFNPRKPSNSLRHFAHCHSLASTMMPPTPRIQTSRSTGNVPADPRDRRRKTIDFMHKGLSRTVLPLLSPLR